MRKAATRAASLDRNRFEGYFLLGCSFMDEGKATDAIRCFKEAASIAPQRSQTWLALGLAYEQADEPALAIEAYGQADSNQGRALIAQVETLDD